MKLSLERRPAAVVISLVVGAAALYCWVAYAGPYRWLAEWQLAHGGMYREKLTLLGTLLVFYVVAAPLLYATRKSARRPTIDELRGGSFPLEQRVPPSLRQRRRVAAAFAVLGLVCIGLAIGLGWGAASPAEPAPATGSFVLEGPNQPIPTLSSARVSGLAQPALIVSLDTQIAGSTRTRTYVPLTWPGWQPGEPLRVFLDTNQDAYLSRDGPVRSLRLDASETPFRFTSEPARLSEGSLPGAVRERYRRQQIALAEPLYLVEQGADAPLRLYVVGLVVGVVGFSFLLAAAMSFIAMGKRPLVDETQR